MKLPLLSHFPNVHLKKVSTSHDASVHQTMHLIFSTFTGTSVCKASVHQALDTRGWQKHLAYILTWKSACAPQTFTSRVVQKCMKNRFIWRRDIPPVQLVLSSLLKKGKIAARLFFLYLTFLLCVFCFWTNTVSVNWLAVYSTVMQLSDYLWLQLGSICCLAEKSVKSLSSPASTRSY